MEQYYIIGIYKNKKHYLDCFNSITGAGKAYIEYKLAYGKDWIIDIVLK